MLFVSFSFCNSLIDNVLSLPYASSIDFLILSSVVLCFSWQVRGTGSGGQERIQLPPSATLRGKRKDEEGTIVTLVSLTTLMASFLWLFGLTPADDP